MPTVDRQDAPISEINGSKFGIATAKKTVKQSENIRINQINIIQITINIQAGSIVLFFCSNVVGWT